MYEIAHCMRGSVAGAQDFRPFHLPTYNSTRNASLTVVARLPRFLSTIDREE